MTTTTGSRTATSTASESSSPSSTTQHDQLLQNGAHGGSQSATASTRKGKGGAASSQCDAASLGDQFAKLFPANSVGGGSVMFPTPAPHGSLGGLTGTGEHESYVNSSRAALVTDKASRRADQANGSGTANGSRLTEELEDFVERGLEGALAAERGDKDAPSEEAIAEMQLQTARKLRQLLPTTNQRDILPMLQETQNWISLLLGWLANSHDRPAVQIEALLALTNIAGLSPHSPAPPSPVRLQSQPLPSASQTNAPLPFSTSACDPSHAQDLLQYNMDGGLGTNDAVAALAASAGSVGAGAGAAGGVGQGWLSNLSAASHHGSHHHHCAPPADITSTYNILLHHPSAIPTLVSLLLSPHGEVHGQAMWILGSIVVASGHGSGGLGCGASSAATAGAFHHTGSTATDGGPMPTTTSSSSSAGPHEYGGMAPPPSGGGAAGAAAARELVLAAGIVGPLCACLNNNAWNIPLQRIGSWLLSNLVLPSSSTTAAAAAAATTSASDGNGSGQKHNGGAGMKSDSSTDLGGKGSKNGKGDVFDPSSSDRELRGAWQIDSMDMQKILPTLRRLLQTSDADILSHTCWALSHLCDGPSSHIAAVVAGDCSTGSFIPSRLVDLLLHPSWRVTKPALRTIGNVVCAECTDDTCVTGASGSNGGIPPPPPDYTEIVLQCGAVPHLKQLISHNNREIQKEACWTLSNIAAGTVEQIQAVIDSGAIPPLVKLASDPNTDHEVRSEACWVVLNATSCGSDAQVEVLIAEGCVSVLGVLLGEASMVMMALEGLERVLQVEEVREKARQRASGIQGGDKELTSKAEAERNVISTSFVSASLMDTLEQHKNTAIAKRAGRIWKQHFVSCALCRNYFSKHRSSEARFCNECKCYVCSSCNCQVYHLSYQEELWAASEEKTQTKVKAKKSKKQKKKEKKKQAKKTAAAVSNQETGESAVVDTCVVADITPNVSARERDVPAPAVKPPVTNGEEESVERSLSASSTESGSVGPSHDIVDSGRATESVKAGGSQKAQRNSSRKPDVTGKGQSSRKGSVGSSSKTGNETVRKKRVGTDNPPPQSSASDDLGKESGEEGSPVDLVLYLQQTGSMIALAKLMDALEYDKRPEDECETFATKEGIVL